MSEALRLFDPPIESLPPGRLPIAPLVEAIGGLRATATLLGLSRAAVYRLCQTGVSYERADRYAIRAGTHPGLLWPEWWVDQSA